MTEAVFAYSSNDLAHASESGRICVSKYSYASLVKEYLEVYSITDYIYEVIKLLKEQEALITDQLLKEQEESLITNKEVHERIEKYNQKKGNANA